jgi:hypothetical protein
MKLELLTNATVIDDTIGFLSQKSKENLRPYFATFDEDGNGSKELDYDEDEDTHKQEGEQEADKGEVTTNHVF